jgi:hypothetical protein
LTLHILDLASESFHGYLKDEEDLLLDILELCVIGILEHVEACLDKDLYKIFFYLLLIPEELDIKP